MIVPDEPSSAAGRRNHMAAASTSVAEVLTTVLAPTWTMLMLQLAVAVRSTPTLAGGLWWSLIAPGGTTLIPWLFVVRGVRRGRYTDVHLGVREQRRVPLLVATGCALGALVLLAAGGAPRALQAVVGAILAQLLVAMWVSRRWKVSVHAACVASAVTVWALLAGAWWLLLVFLVGMVCWARVQLGDHSWAQTLVGAALGAAISAVVFPLLR